ncbi:MAG: hypothetical protein IT383_14640 [Deltaproteobacteria bacterium]|nr:hypothetical protein [Deltaproteobacteria bacterium]
MARLRAFFHGRWPLAPNLAGAAALSLSLSFVAQAAAQAGSLVLGPREVYAFLVAAGTSLLMRAYDELKDVETDLKLAASGDATFATRPIATGEIERSDLVLVKWLALVTFSIGAAGAVATSSFPWWTAGGCLAIVATVWLSSRWFFWPRIQRDLVLAFVTHNPIAGVVGAALVAVVARAAVEPLVLMALIASSWFPISAWEVARKLRAPADETSYETYSKRLGVGGAAALLAACVVLSLSSLVVLALATAAAGAYLWVASAVGGALLVGALRFALRPSAASARLRPFAEAFALVATVGLPVALGIAHGVRFEGSA